MEPQSNDSELYYQHTEIELLRDLLSLLPHKVAIDVGAEKGGFIQFLLDSGITCVYAFEPFPENVSIIKNKYLDDPRVTAFDMALADREGIADLHLAEDENGATLDVYHTLRVFGKSPAMSFKRSLPVRCCRLATLERNGTFPKLVDLLKVDTEGNDFVILQNLGELRPLLIMCEFWFEIPQIFQENTASIAEFAELLAGRGYGNFCVIKRNDGFERVVINSTEITTGDWGNIIFIHNDVFSTISQKLFDFCSKFSRSLVGQAKYFRYHATERQRIIDDKQRMINDDLSKIFDEIALIKEIIHGMFLNSRFRSVVELPRDLIERVNALVGVSQELATIRSALGTLKEEQRGLKAFASLRRLHPRLARLLNRLHSRLAGPLNRLYSRLAGCFLPRLGMLKQYAPKAIEIPAKYYLADGGDASLSISIVIPSFNQGAYVGRTVASILDQGYPYFECIVHDNLSTDDTKAVLAGFGDRITVYAEKDNGQGDAVNRGLRHATGDILAYLNSDDLLLPGSLRYVADYFARHPKVDVIYGHRVLIDANDAEIGRWVLPPHSNFSLQWADFVPQETLFWRRRLWKKVGGVDTSFSFASDWDLILRFQEAGAMIVRLPRFLGAFRVHDAQKTSELLNTVGAAEMARIRRRMLGRNPTGHEIHRNLRLYYFQHLVCHYGYKLGWIRY